MSEQRNLLLIEEEIDDLTEYLKGLPAELRQGDAFRSYRERLKLLQDELREAELSEARTALNNAAWIPYDDARRVLQLT